MLASSCAVLEVAVKSLVVEGLGTRTFSSRLLSLKSAGVLPLSLMGVRLSPLMVCSWLSLSEQEREQQELTSVRGEKHFVLPFSRLVMEKSRMLLTRSTEAAQLLETHPETELKLYLMLLAEKTNLSSVSRIHTVRFWQSTQQQDSTCVKVERKKEAWYQWHTGKSLCPPLCWYLSSAANHLVERTNPTRNN